MISLVICQNHWDLVLGHSLNIGVWSFAASTRYIVIAEGDVFLQDCGATLRVAIHDAERRATMRLAAL
jgi:hypothetical protein